MFARQLVGALLVRTVAFLLRFAVVRPPRVVTHARWGAIMQDDAPAVAMTVEGAAVRHCGGAKQHFTYVFTFSSKLVREALTHPSSRAR